MTRLHRLYDEHGQSPWLDNLARPQLRGGTLADLVAAGVRGVTANPTILARAIVGSDAYDEQFGGCVRRGLSVEEAYWDLVIDDVVAALHLLRPTFDVSGGTDGFVSIEVAPDVAFDTGATMAAARALHQRIGQPNLFVKIPATAEGVPAIEAMIAEGRNINVTLVFSLTRYDDVIEAYMSGLETLAARGGDVAGVRSVATFFVSRVDTEVDRRLRGISGPEARSLVGLAGVAQARLAYQLFRRRFSGERWARLAAAPMCSGPCGRRPPPKDPALPDTLYVDSLIGPDTVNTLPEATLAAFEDHGTLARTIDAGLDDAAEVLARLERLGVDIDDVGWALEVQGVAAFRESFAHVLGALGAKAQELAA